MSKNRDRWTAVAAVQSADTGVRTTEQVTAYCRNREVQLEQSQQQNTAAVRQPVGLS